MVTATFSNSEQHSYTQIRTAEFKTVASYTEIRIAEFEQQTGGTMAHVHW